MAIIRITLGIRARTAILNYPLLIVAKCPRRVATRMYSLVMTRAKKLPQAPKTLS